MKPICIYHGHCDDGFAAAWAVRHAAPDAFDFYPGVYQQDPPDVTDRHVLMVDFSYKRPVLERMAAVAKSVVIFDHHKTAAEDLADLPAPAPFADWPRTPPVGLSAVFDMDRSGAGLTWDLTHKGERPRFIDYIEDRDLWRKALPSGDEFTIALRSYPQDFETWDDIINGLGADGLIEQGEAIQRYYRLRVEELKRSAYPAVIAGMPCYIANAPYFAASEVAGELGERSLAFGACYFEVSQGRWQYSLRSSKIDVGAFARQFGGGGHAGAAGFTVDAPVHTTGGPDGR